MVKGAFEYNPNKYLVIVNGEAKLYFLDLNSNEMNDSLANPSGETTFYQLLPVPNFDPKTLPLVFIKDKAGITLVNTHS